MSATDHLDTNERDEVNRIHGIVTEYINGLTREMKDNVVEVFRQRTVLRQLFMQVCNQAQAGEGDNRWNGTLEQQQDASEAQRFLMQELEDRYSKLAEKEDELEALLE